MADVIDPYSYFKKDSPWAPSVEGTNFAAMPKLVVNAGNDEFCAWQLTSATAAAAAAATAAAAAAAVIHAGVYCFCRHQH